MNDDDFAKIVKHGSLDCVGPAAVEALVARGERRAGLVKLVSALMHRCFDEGAADAGVTVPELTICERHPSVKH